MKRKLDARNLTCPHPVIETKKVLSTLQKGQTLEVLVDNHIAVQNLCKMAGQKKISVTSEKIDEDNYLVNFFPKAGSHPERIDEPVICYPDQTNDTVIVLASDKMGEGDERFGKILMKGFIYALTELDILPSCILLYNNGAKLSTEGSDSLEDLKLLESHGVEILTCGACLDFYELTEKLKVGSVTNMYAIAEKMLESSKVVRP